MTANKIDVYVGKRLKMARVLRDMTQYDLGSKVGVTLQQVQKYERGCNRISASKLYLMAKTLRVGVDYFYKGYVDTEDTDSAVVIGGPVDLHEDVADFECSVFGDSEAITAAKLYVRIADHNVRKMLLGLIRSLSALSA